MSSGPPAGKGTTYRIAFAGYAVCAAAGAAAHTKIAARAARLLHFCMMLNRVAGIHAIEFAHHRGPHQLAAFGLAAFGINLASLVDRMIHDLARQLVQLGA